MIISLPIPTQDLVDLRAHAYQWGEITPSRNAYCECGDCRRMASFMYVFRAMHDDGTEASDVDLYLCTMCSKGQHPTPPANWYAHSGDLWHGGKVDDGYAQHGEFASQVRCEDERNYEPDPYDADDAWR